MIRSMWKPLLGLLTAAAVGLGAEARATFSISISSPAFVTHTNSTAGTTLISPGNPGSFDFTATNPSFQGDFSGRYNLFTVDTPSLAQINTTGTGLRIVNNNGSNITVTVTITKDDFTGGPSGYLSTGLSVTSAVGAGNTFSYTASAGPNPASLSATNVSLNSGSANLTLFTPFTRGVGNLTITETFILNLRANTNITILANSPVQVSPLAPAPVPATALAALAALPVLGIGLRRRAKTVVA